MQTAAAARASRAEGNCTKSKRGDIAHERSAKAILRSEADMKGITHFAGESPIRTFTTSSRSPIAICHLFSHSFHSRSPRHQVSDFMAQKHHFLLLPGEIRNLIYSLVFADIADKAIIRLNSRKHLFKRRQRQLALLLVCRQIHLEAFGYVYGLVRAVLRLPDKGGNYLYPWTSKRRITRGLDSFGHVLPFVSRLGACGLRWSINMLANQIIPDINDAESLTYLGLYHSYSVNPFKGLSISQSNTKMASVRKDLGGFYRLLCQRLCNIEIITVVGTWARCPLWPANYWLLDVLPWREERKRIMIALPKLVEIRVVPHKADLARGREVGARFRPRADGEWVALDSEEVVPCMDDILL